MKYVQLMRIKHYIKNILVFLPLIFSKNVFNAKAGFETIKGFLAFSFAASVVYIINDIRDREADRCHPEKKNRPLASGEVSVKEGVILALLLAMTGGIIGFSLLHRGAVFYIFLYLILNFLYSIKLKQVPVTDVFVIALGFILRVQYGSALTGVATSSWLYLTVMSFSFFLAFGKRRNELKDVNDHIYAGSREVLHRYNHGFLHMHMYMCLTMGLIFYSLWTASLDSPYMIYSVLLVLFIVFRYNLDIEGRNLTGDPVEVLTGDWILILMCLTYALYILVILYM